jgi:hypothetical protein
MGEQVIASSSGFVGKKLMPVGSQMLLNYNILLHTGFIIQKENQTAICPFIIIFT